MFIKYYSMLNGFITSQLAILPSLKSYTHTGLLLAIRSVLLVVFSLISISILTRIFDKDTYGLIAYVNSIWGMLSVFNLTGTPTALTNSIAKGLHGTYLFLLRKLVPYSILGVCATAICGFWLHNYDNSEAGTILLLLSPFFLLKPLEYAKPFFTAVGRYNQLLQLELVFSFISFIIVTTLVIYTKSACNYLLSGTILSSLFAIYLFRRSRDYIANNNIHNVSYINSLTFSGINIFFLLATKFDKFLVGKLAGLSALADYAIAYSIYSTFDSFIKNLLTPHIVKLARESVVINFRIIRKNSRLYLLFGFACAIAYAISVFFLSITVLPEKYQLGVRYAYLFVLSIFVSPFITIEYSLMKYQILPGLILKTDICLKILKLMLFILLLPTLGIYGLIMSIVAVDIISLFLYNYAIMRRVHKFD